MDNAKQLWADFDRLYRKACDSSAAVDWQQAALAAQQVRNQQVAVSDVERFIKNYSSGSADFARKMQNPCKPPNPAKLDKLSQALDLETVGELYCLGIFN